jgi:hypothetical protein
MKIRQPHPTLDKAPDGAPGVMLPIRTHNTMNGSGGNRWGKSRDRKRIRATTKLMCRGKFPLARPAVVTLTRYSPCEMDDDGLASALKAVRDGVADAFGCDDARKSGLKFVYEQAKAKGHGVRVSVAPPAPDRI